MSQTTATILIPDISGFTEFVTNTELTHSSLAINMLIDAIVKALDETYEVSEIEGDAVLILKKDPPPTRQELMDTCIKIFNAFHFQRRWMQDYTICPCGACQALVHLSLKFIVHHGPLAEIKVGRFLKHSGKEMIVAHRLLKNSIDNQEYLLLTEKVLNELGDVPEKMEMEWVNSSEEYTSIGKVDYRFALLSEARKKVPQPPVPPKFYSTDNTAYIEMPVQANYLDVYMTMMNVPGRASWLQGLEKVEQEIENVFIGSMHQCTFNNYQAVISPLQMTVSPDSILYIERCSIPEMDLSLVHEFDFKKTGENECMVAFRCINTGDTEIAADVRAGLLEKMKAMGKDLRDFCESANNQANG